jgi:hypothetical protein
MVTGVQTPAVAATPQGDPSFAMAMQVEPRELRHESPIEVIFCKCMQEAVPPKFRPRAAKHTVFPLITQK